MPKHCVFPHPKNGMETLKKKEAAEHLRKIVLHLKSKSNINFQLIWKLFRNYNSAHKHLSHFKSVSHVTEDFKTLHYFWLILRLKIDLFR